MTTASRLLSWGPLSCVLLQAAANATAGGAPPPNDLLASAVIVPDAPGWFIHTVSVASATVEPGEPTTCGSSRIGQTVWYAFTPSQDVGLLVRAMPNAVGRPALGAFTGDQPDRLTALDCDVEFEWGTQLLIFRARAGTTYRFQVGIHGASDYGSGSLTFKLQQVPLPQNDDFANATIVGQGASAVSVPGIGLVGTEPGEPLLKPPRVAYFNGPDDYELVPESTIWYRLRLPATSLVSVQAPSKHDSFLAAYQGRSLDDLVPVAASPVASPVMITPGLIVRGTYDGDTAALLFVAQQCETYHVQAGTHGGILSEGLKVEFLTIPSGLPASECAPETGTPPGWRTREVARMEQPLASGLGHARFFLAGRNNASDPAQTHRYDLQVRVGDATTVLTFNTFGAPLPEFATPDIEVNLEGKVVVSVQATSAPMPAECILFLQGACYAAAPLGTDPIAATSWILGPSRRAELVASVTLELNDSEREVVFLQVPFAGQFVGAPL